MGEVSPTNRVRAACKAVAERSTHVRVNHERISPYALSLPLEQIRNPELDPAVHYLGHGDDTLAFLITLNAVNFGSGYFPHLRKRPGRSGYFTIAASLNDRYREQGPLPAQELARITADDCARIFGQDPGNGPVCELMQLFATAWNDLGRYLLSRFSGSFVGLVEAASSSAERLVQLLIEMPFFNDVELYEGLEVPFYKRAQLTAADLSTAFAGQGPDLFGDLDRLTIFADNLVPHVLRVDGVLLYEDELSARIDTEQLIPSGSAEEVEMRACAVQAVEMLAQELPGVSAMQLDYLLWNRGQLPYYKARPRHRTRTVYY